MSPARTVEERQAAGKEARKVLPRSALADFEAADDKRDPVDLFLADDADRLPELVPIKYGRMLTSSFAFYRGAAALMAFDLGNAPHSGIETQLCGDAHLSNFGLFGAPDRRLVFDINDFDETHPGPWEWDVKRLAASVVIAMRSIGGDEADQREAACEALARYRERMIELAGMGNLDVWYARLEIDQVRTALESHQDPEVLKRLNKSVEKAYTKDSLRELDKLTEVVDGRRRIISDPPLIVPVEEIFKELGGQRLGPEQYEQEMDLLLDGYKAGLATDRRHLLDQYRVVHMARKVVGVGSVGMRSWIVLLVGRDESDPLFLQVKEAGQSVLEAYTAPSKFELPGQRVIAGQRLMQAATDVLIGWQSVPDPAGITRHFYVRQLKDWKGSAKIEKQSPHTLKMYAGVCGRVLARAHARAGDRVAIASYLGKGDQAERAVAEYALAYADQNERDYARMQEAVADGRIVVQSGI